MTTIAYDRTTKTIAADTQNTDASGQKWKCHKIVTDDKGNVFAGSGHMYTISQVQNWAFKYGLRMDKIPDWSYYLDDPEDRDFSCLFITNNGDTVYLIDGELTPLEVFDDKVAVGAGAAYALGAMHAGASAMSAVQIACTLDTNSSYPVDVHVIK